MIISSKKNRHSPLFLCFYVFIFLSVSLFLVFYIFSFLTDAAETAKAAEWSGKIPDFFQEPAEGEPLPATDTPIGKKFWGNLGGAKFGALGGKTTLPEGEFPLLVTVSRVINSILFFVGGIFIILILAGGVLWMTAGGNEEQVKKARDILTKSFIGFVIIMAGYLITFTIVRAYLWAAM